MMKLTLRSIVLAGLFALSQLALANPFENPAYYVGVNFGQPNVNMDTATSTEVKTTSGIRTGVLWPVFKDMDVGAELNYEHARFSTNEDSTQVSVHGFGLSTVLRFSVVGNLWAYGKLGINHTAWEMTDATLSAKGSRNNTTYALGTQYRFTPQVSASFEYTHFYKEPSLRIGAWQAGLEYQF